MSFDARSEARIGALMAINISDLLRMRRTSEFNEIAGVKIRGARSIVRAL